MNSDYKVVIAQIRPSEISIPYPSILSPSENKCEDSDERYSHSDSLKMLGSSLTMNFSENQASAFSLYEPAANEDFCQSPLQNSIEEQDFEGEKQQGENSKCRKWKKIKRSKREMSRLQTKNLNRYFRSKINEMLRDIKENPTAEEESEKASEMLIILNKSNNIMFSELRQIIKDVWLQKKLTKCSGILLKYIHKGKMGTYSKMIMLKYYNKIMKAIRNPDNFSFWK